MRTDSSLPAKEETTAPGRIESLVESEVGWIWIDNQRRRNALSLAMWAAITEAIQRFEADLEVRCIVIAGRGRQAFAAGADISEFETSRSTLDAIAHYNRVAMEAMETLHAATKPTLAMIHGYCVGGGLALALCCDLRVAEAAARFSIPAAKLGIGYDYPGIKRLVDLVGPSRAKDIFFTARLVEAGEAFAMGLVNKVTVKDELEQDVRTIVRMITCNAPLSIRSAKLSVNTAVEDGNERDIAACDAAETACFSSEDYVEGRRAFCEKRSPVFTGR